MKPRLRTRIYAWWYVSIGVGFLLLAINRWIMGESLWLILLRMGIGIGFLLLAVLTLKSNPRT
jgi:hypothetical protein